ncbi:hypothetical protein [Streptomyces bohaiensis]|uniref:hypothetical protein n=1 Tax=Streptomyces bohaiensis TaxID=1431344 RepID=UPI003B7FED3C
MVNDLAQQVAQAMDEPDDQTMFSRIKNTVARRLKETDPQALVTTTEFFNHTHVPDLVVTWPRRPRTPSRHIYLRTTSNQQELNDDLHRLPSENNPVLLTLGHLEAAEHLTEPSGHKLLLDTAAVDSLRPAAGAPDIPQLVSRSVLEGGRGTLDGSTTTGLLTTVADGADAARTGTPGPTQRAVQTASDHLNQQVAGRLSSFLAALWQGSGNTLANFPGPQRTTEGLDVTALMYLLETEEISDAAFWNRIVGMLNLAALLQVPSTGAANLQHLMREAISQWKARACMVVPGSRGPEVGPWKWVLHDGDLVLQTPRFHAVVGTSRKALNPAEGYDLPSLEEVRARAERFGIPLTQLRMSVTDRHIGYGGAGDDISHDEKLDQLSGAINEAKLVIETDARVSSGAVLTCTFGNKTASAHGSRTQVPLDALVGTTIRLQTKLTDEEGSTVEALLGAQGSPPEASWSQPRLDEG